eukprot:1048719-Pelagomonas_calceolata.AAC.4
MESYIHSHLSHVLPHGALGPADSPHTRCSPSNWGTHPELHYEHTSLRTFLISGGGTRKFLGSPKSPSYCIMPANFKFCNT